MRRRRVFAGSRTRCASALLAGAVAPIVMSFSARADRTYTGQGGSWASPGNWTPSGVPANENVTLQPGTNALVIVTYDGLVPTTSTTDLNLFVDSTGTGTVRLQMSANALTITGALLDGYFGTGSISQTGGSLSAGAIALAYNPGSAGSYTLSGGTLTATAGDFNVGRAGIGTFTINGNASFTGPNFLIGTLAGGSGTVSLSNSGRAVVGSAWVGGWYGGPGGLGVINVGAGGQFDATSSLTIFETGASAVNLLGGAATAATLSLSNWARLNLQSGTFTLQGGNTSANGALTVGNAAGASATFSILGGNQTIGSSLVLGNVAGGTGALSLGGGSLSVPTNEYIGYAGSGSVIQTAGSHVPFNLFLGYSNGASGSYSLSGANSALQANNLEYVGYNPGGTGSISQSGGTNTTPNLYLGYSTGSTGNYTLSGGTLNVTQVEKVGYSGNATFTQTGGTHTVGIGMHLGGAWNIPGTQRSTTTYNMSGGSLSVGTPTGPSAEGFLGVGTHDGNGTFNHSGGVVTMNGNAAKSTPPWPNDGLFIGQDVGTSGTYNLSNGASLIVNHADDFIGTGGNGTFNQTGGLHVVNGSNGIFLGMFNSSTSSITTGTYNLFGGTAYASNVFVGGGYANTSNNPGPIVAQGYGNLTVNGGRLSLTNSIQIFNTSLGGTASSFTLNGGTVSAASLTAPDWSRFHFNGGTLNLNGGVSSNGGTLTIGDNARSATLNQSGSNTIVSAYDLTMGNSYGSIGTYNLSGGTLYIVNAEQIGGNGGINSGNAVFNQTGGLHQLGGTPGFGGGVHLGVNWNSGTTRLVSTYNMSGGTYNAGDFLTLLSGDATFNHSGGTVNVTGTNNAVSNSEGLYVGQSDDSNANYNMSNGATLNVVGDEYIGSGGKGTFNQTGGIHTVGGSAGIQIHPFTFGLATNFGTFNLSGGIVSASNVYVGGGYPINGTAIAAGGVGFLRASGGTMNIGGTIQVFNTSAGTNVCGVTVSGSGSVSAGSIQFDGGQFQQSGGSFTASNYFSLGNGSATISGGALSVGLDVQVGSPGLGTYAQSGGTVSVSRFFFIGDGAPTAAGTANISGGSLAVGNTLVIGQAGGGSYVQSNGSVSAAGFMVGSGAPGTASLTGGSITTGSLVIATPGPGSFALSGGTLTASSTFNNGLFSHSNGGSASLGPVTGSGTMTIGGGIRSVLTTVTSFSQQSVTLANGGTLRVATNSTRYTNIATALTITGTGLLDLGNHALRVDNSATPEGAVRQYLRNAYNADASGIGNWLGHGGITAADAIASHNGPNPSFKISVGYVNGAYANDPLIGGPIPGQATLPTNRILVRPALYGDLNLDGKVDDTDLAIFSGLGQYNQPTDKFGWLGGDLNYDGKVDDTDLQIFSGAGNYNVPSYCVADAQGASHASAIPSLTGHAQANGDIVLSSSTSAGAPGDGVLDFVYDPSTGHLSLSYDGDPRVTTAQPFQVVRFKSAGGHFIPANFNPADFGAGVTATTSALNGTASGSNSVPDGYDMGAVLPTGLAIADLTSDLTLQWNVFGGGLTLKNGDVVVPEPALIGLVATLASFSLTSRRSRRRRG